MIGLLSPPSPLLSVIVTVFVGLVFVTVVSGSGSRVAVGLGGQISLAQSSQKL